jgi:hypothetical protein
MRKLDANFQGPRGILVRHGGIPFETGIHRQHNVIEALAQVLRLFAQEDSLLLRHGLRHVELTAMIEVQYPQHYAFITVGARQGFTETWIYGRRGEPRNEQLRRVRQDAMREISRALRDDVFHGSPAEDARNI